MNALLLTAALMLGQVQQAPPVKEVSIPPQAPPVQEESQPLDYAKSLELSTATWTPMVTFVNCEPRQIEGFLTVKARALDGYPSRCVVVSNRIGQWRATLPINATDADVLDGLAQKAVQPMATPFGRSNSLPQAPPVGHDGNDVDEVSSILEGMERYTATKIAQVSENLSGGGSNFVVSRFTLPSKWHQPGGLEGLTGWSNRLYRKRGNPVHNWLGHVDAGDRWADGRVIGAWGGLSEVAYQRVYGDGARFADVLATDRGVFEVRVAEKIDGEWRRSVPYRDHSAEPIGYKRVSLQQCAECHAQAGDGSYGTARIIGGDGVLSEPLALLER